MKFLVEIVVSTFVMKNKFSIQEKEYLPKKCYRNNYDLSQS